MYTFETHITVECTSKELYKTFQEVCEQLKVKPIIINVLVDNQVMTSGIVKAKDKQKVIEIIKQQSDVLLKHGIVPLRLKIEAEPKYIKDTQSSFYYSEVHLLMDTDVLNCVSQLPIELHKSSNEFKPGYTFLTYRKVFDITPDIKKLMKWSEDIHNASYKALTSKQRKCNVEFAIFDTNQELDKEWMSLRT